MTFRSGALLTAAMCVLWAGTAQAEGEFAMLSGVVNPNGRVVQDSGVETVTHVATGNYLVTFVRDVSACAVAIAPRGPGSADALTRATGNPKQVRIMTFARRGGGPADLGFSVTVNCAPSSTVSHGMALLYARVGTGGNLVKGAGAVAATKFGTGEYGVSFNRPVDGCAYAATAAGITGNPYGLPETTAQITINPMEGDSTSVFVRRGNTAGHLTNRPFQVIVICMQ
jgi:hypothetical protein